MLNVSYLSFEEIQGAANRFLSEQDVEEELPVPIEEIVEINLGIDIIPFRGLQDRFDIDGFLSNDMTAITVDESILEKRPTRYRFTLAHEIGHLELHPDFIRAMRPATIEEWKASIQNIPEQTYRRVEFQAYEFAGRVLVPSTLLLTAWQEATAQAERRGVNLTELGDFGVEQIAGKIAKQFQVSTDVILRRLRREGLVGEKS